MATIAAREAAPVAWTRAVKWGQLSMVAALGLGIALFVAQVFGFTPLAQDAWVYWHAQPGALYADRFAWSDAPFTYSPAFALVLEPVRLLPPRVFTGLFQLALVGVLVVTIRGWALPLLLIGYVAPWPMESVAGEVAMGNVEILLGAVAVFGLRWPALWSFALLSKVTPGVGLVWFLARREWRHLGIALAATAALMAVSFAIHPGDWFAWATFLQHGQDFPLWVIPVPLWVRVPMSAALVWWGAVTDRPWVVPIAVGWAIPIPYATMLATMACALHYLSLGARPAARGSVLSPRSPSARASG